MIARSYITANLKIMESKYRGSKTQKESLFYSKLAILELCGWIEESMDDVVIRCARRHVKSKRNMDYVMNDIVRRTFGFEYDRHFRRMLIQLLGLINVEKLERRVDPVKRDRLKATLATLKSARDSEAHTHIKGVTRRINAPSVTLSQLPAVYDGLREYESVIRNSAF